MEKLFGIKKNTALLCLFSTLLGIMFNVLFYRYRFGINYPIFMAMILISTFWALSFKEYFNVFLLYRRSCRMVMPTSAVQPFGDLP